MRSVRLVSRFLGAAAITACVGWPSLVHAQSTPALIPTEASAPALTLSLCDLPPCNTPAERQDLFALHKARTAERRPGALIPLYVSLVALQGLDVYSTKSALDAGTGREANPAMRGVVHHGPMFVAVKAGATAGVIWASEKMWRKNRKAAVIFASLVNAAMAGIVANNYSHR